MRAPGPSGSGGEPSDVFRRFLEHSPMGVVLLRLLEDGSLLVTWANPAADRILRRDCQALVGRRLREAFPTLDGSEIPARLAEVASRGAVWRSEAAFAAPGPGRAAGPHDGGPELAAVELLAFPLSPGEVAVALQDKTAERAAERALLESRARYQAVMRSVPVAVFALDREGVYTHCDGSAVAAAGLAIDRVVGRNLAEVHGGHPRILADFRRALAGETFTSETRVGGGVFEIRWGPLRDQGGEVAGAAGVALEITAQHRLREQAQRAQQLEALARLAGSLANDFNNLMTVILNGAECLHEDADAGRPASAQDLEQIREAGQRARELVGRLLAFSGRQAAAPAPTDVAAVLRGVEPRLRRALGEGIDLLLTIDPELWPALCEAGHLEQILLDLARNARDAMPGGGVLGLSAANAHVAAEESGQARCPAGDWVRLRVRDTGVGMTPEVEARLFEPFFTTKGPGKGAGLGLATAHGLVAQAGGHVHVETEDGRGTTFQICLPRGTEPAAPPAPRPRADAGTILVVDDDPLADATTCRALREAGYRVEVARDGREALDRIARQGRPPALLVADMTMPGMSGPALAAHLAQRGLQGPVLFLSGEPGQGVVAPALPRDAQVLARPFSGPELLARVRGLLDGREEAEPR